MKVYYVDTNVFLRFLLKDNIDQYKEIESLLRKAKDKKVRLRVPVIVIFEISFVLKSYYHLSKDEIIGMLESLVALSYVKIDEREVFSRAIQLYKSSVISFVDCFLIAKAQIEGKELFTFDKDLKKLLTSSMAR